ncbi:restriction endonuclease subunit S [Aequorivita sediminis]|uniref:restriction endonuclease subunit S n=1 Tax=Aequorivita sediminis TaxID=3073653 RepID=UPI0028B0FCD3|nr:restriction endonuclease subunit S [Aequorivita sp. F6058]
MTLHEAIEFILQESGRPMSSREIADIINKSKLYLRRDGKSVSASQVSARVGNYEKVFVKDSGKIKLLKDDYVSLKLQNYKNKLKYLVGSSNHHSIGGKMAILIDALEALKFESNKESDYDSNDSQVSEPGATYRSALNRDKFKVAFRLCNWYLSQDSSFRVILTAQFVSVLSGLNWFQKGNHILSTEVPNSNHFLLKIVGDNPKSNFKIDNKQSQTHEFNEDLIDSKLNCQVEDFINENNVDFQVNSKSCETKIIIPSFNKRLKNNGTSVFESLFTHFKNFKTQYDKIILIIPASALTSLRKDDLLLREIIVESGYLDSVVLFPNKMMENSGVILSVLIFDFRKPKKEVFFFDCSNTLKENPKSIAEIINDKTQITDVSKSISTEHIDYKTCSLFPREYVFNPYDIEVKPGYSQYSLSELITNKKSGGRFKSRNSLYSGGEYKLIRTNEIDNDVIHFQPKENMIGIDHDELMDVEKSLIKGGIVVSGFNKKLKASVLSSEETYVLGQDVYWLKLDNELIINEYLVKEFSKAYVTKQVIYHSKGTTISRLYLKDLLNIQLQIPSIEKQKEILFADLNKEDKVSNDNGVTDKELDFIKTLKHTLKQPASSLGNDFSSLSTFIKNKIIDKTPLQSDETIVPIFPSDTPEQISIHTLMNTLDRMTRAVTDIDYILDQAVKVIEISKPINKENINLKTFLQNFIAEYPSIAIKVTGPQVDILADRKQLRILVHNFINNAIKHGFSDLVENPIIWLEIKTKDTLSIQLSIRNNGLALPSEFTLKDFLAKGATTNADVGSGFGGFLIGRILENHKAEITLTKKEDFGILPHTVEFIITLPK